MWELINKKCFLYDVAIVTVVVVSIVLVMILFSTSPPSLLFTVRGKQQPMESIHSDYLQSSYDVINWNFTFAYNDENALHL